MDNAEMAGQHPIPYQTSVSKTSPLVITSNDLEAGHWVNLQSFEQGGPPLCFHHSKGSFNDRRNPGMMGVKLVLDSSLKMVTVGVNDGHQGLETKISFPKTKYSGGYWP